MRRIAHGATFPIKPPSPGGNIIALPSSVPPAQAAGTPFGYLFEDLVKEDENLLPESSVTLDNLARLGDAMGDTPQSSNLFSGIPSAYTYFGQFLDHDITFTDIPKTPRDLTDSCMLADSLLTPWPLDVIKREVKNKRASILELDSVYGGEEKPPTEDVGNLRLLKVGPVTRAGHGLPGRDELNDVPRGPKSGDPAKDRAALIGDPRNDQTVLISQLHVAFLRAHNAIVRLRQCSFDEAREILRQHYHCIIVQDFLSRVTAPGTVEAVLADPLYKPEVGNFFLPLEFTVAAFRFGHSMIRSVYYLNDNYPSRDLGLLFTLKALRGHDTIPEEMVVEWKAFLDGFIGQGNTSRLLDTRLIDPLRVILDEAERPVPCETRLAVLDLKRGYMMRMPTGQKVARRLGLHEMTPAEIENAVGDEGQKRVLRESGFLERTPLWFYIMAEAASEEGGGGGRRLGPVGSRLVAEVLIGLIRRSQPSILSKTDPPWAPTLPSKVAGRFDLADLLRLARVLID